MSPEFVVTSARVLVVDDDEGLLFLMAETLIEEGFTVETVLSWSEAATYLETNPVDLVLLDLKLKDVAGVALIERLREVDAGIPFIVVTGQGDERVAVDIMKQGALDYVMKDTAMLDLLPTVVNRAVTSIQRERELVSAGEERRRLEREVVEESERQQRRIGADLHDGLGQQLTAIEMMCASLKSDLVNEAPHMVPQIRRIGGMLRDAISQTRAIARGLVPVRDAPEALWESLAELAHLTHGLGRLTCRFDSPLPVAIQDHVVAGHLYRIAQEAVNNAVKYSKASEVLVSLEQDTARGIVLTVGDNGEGLPVDCRSGVGLPMLRHRATMIGATLTIDSTPGAGVRVTCVLPPTAATVSD